VVRWARRETTNLLERDQLVSKEGGYTVHFPDGEETTIYEISTLFLIY
jgi:aconitase A